MKLVAFSVILVGAVCLAPAQSLSAQANKFDKAIASAMMKKDFKTLENLLKGGVTSDFVYEEGGQKQNFATMFSNMKMGLSSMKTLTKCEAKSSNLKEMGNKGTGNTTHVMVGTTMGGDKKSHTMSFIGTSTDTYVKVGGKWKMSHMSMKTFKMTMDGKPMPAMAGAAK